LHFDGLKNPDLVTEKWRKVSDSLIKSVRVRRFAHFELPSSRNSSFGTIIIFVFEPWIITICYKNHQKNTTLTTFVTGSRQKEEIWCSFCQAKPIFRSKMVQFIWYSPYQSYIHYTTWNKADYWYFIM